MWTLAFWRAILERALSTAAQAALGVVISAVTLGELDWRVVGSTVLIATLASVLKGIGAAAVTDGSPSLSNAEVLTPAEPKYAIVDQMPPATFVNHGITTYFPGNGQPPTSTLN
jgi:hypothetical protein